MYFSALMLVSLFYSDVDECKDGRHTCDQNAKCTDNVGSYTCECRVGYNGDGNMCNGE